MPASEAIITNPKLDSEANPIKHFAGLDSLRGLASVSVAWFHLMYIWGGVAAVVSFSKYGHFGVNLFFVISGFIIPWSMNRAGYSYSMAGRFLLKRIARIEPPYLLSALLALIFSFLGSHAPGYSGPPFHLNWPALFSHLGYLNFFNGLPWLQPVFWSLAVEFMFYMSMALIFPLLNSKDIKLRFSAILVLLALIPFNRHNHFQFGFNMPFFLIGIVLFQWKANLASGFSTCIYIITLVCISQIYMNIGQVLAGVGSALLVAFLNRPIPILHQLGVISFSLYLVHIPVGSRIGNLCLRYLPHSPAWSIASALLSIFASVLFAIAFYYLAEVPAHRLSSRIRFRR